MISFLDLLCNVYLYEKDRGNSMAQTGVNIIKETTIIVSS